MLWSSDVGVYLTMFRAYSADLGRWLSRDPLKSAELVEGSNVYTYVGNDPVNRIDRLGLAQGWGEGPTISAAYEAAKKGCEGSCQESSPGSKVEHRPKSDRTCHTPSSMGSKKWSCSVSCTCIAPPAPGQTPPPAC
jgi:RHS repeat-associated protein